MNICFFHAGFSNIGGIERAASILLNELSLDEKYELYSLEYTKIDNKCLYNINENVKRENVFEEQISMATAIMKRHIIAKVRAFIRKNDIDIIVACGALYFPVAVLSAKRTQAKVICWEHTNPHVVGNYKFQKMARRFGLKRSDKNVLITARALAVYESIKKGKNTLIYNPVDNALFEKDAAYDADSQKIISVGRLCYAKNYDALIEIAQEVLTAHKDWSWDIYGGGEEFDRLNQKISSSSIADQLTLKGNVLDIYDRYANYSFIVMTSRYEGFPFVLLEASAKALPMVSFDIETGPGEIISNGQNGYLIPEGDKKLFVENLNTLIDNKELRRSMSANSYQTSKRFRIDKISLQWKALFEEMLS